MSNKSAKSTKKLVVPRELAEIQAAYQQQCSNAGQLQYQIGIYTQELAKINEVLGNLNREASARQQLDNETKSKESPSGK